MEIHQCPVLCLYTHLYMFLQKMTQHVDSGTCFYMLSRVFRAVPVCFGDDIGIPVCHFVRCRKHSSYSVFSVHKTMCNLSFCASFPYFKSCCFVLTRVPFVNLLMICISMKHYKLAVAYKVF